LILPFELSIFWYSKEKQLADEEVPFCTFILLGIPKKLFDINSVNNIP
jgi:hypothetical protein